jgi:hypothetical protein
MSLKLNERYPGRFNNPSADYPQGSFKNRTSPSAKDGSYLERDWANDKEGFFQSLLEAAGVEANGSVDKVGSSQFFESLLRLGQSQAGLAFTTSGVAPAFTLTPTPAITAYAANQRFRVKFNAAASASGTLNVSGLGAKNLKQYDSSGNKVAASVVSGQLADVEYDGIDMVVLDPLPVSSNLIGSATNVKMTVSVASASATLTADEIIVGTALGGQTYRLPTFNKAVNLANTGAGGRDTGAVPVNGYLALYAIYNPATDTSALLAVNATSTIAPAVYGGANMPAGYTASALLTVVPTNASSQFKVCSVRGRSVSITLATVLTSTSNVAASNISISAAVPPNAVRILGELGMSSSSASNLSVSIFSEAANNVGQQNVSGAVAAAGNLFGNFSGVLILTPQTVGVSASTSGAGPTFNVYVGGYDI